jgi:hypothetical protein
MIKLSRSKMTVIACIDAGRDKPCPYSIFSTFKTLNYLLSNVLAEAFPQAVIFCPAWKSDSSFRTVIAGVVQTIKRGDGKWLNHRRLLPKNDI